VGEEFGAAWGPSVLSVSLEKQQVRRLSTRDGGEQGLHMRYSKLYEVCGEAVAAALLTLRV
jgi:hypothetical protein